MLLDLLFKHITNVSVFQEKFDVLRMFRLVSSRYRHVRKCNLNWFYLLYLFIQYYKRISGAYRSCCSSTIVNILEDFENASP